MVKDIALFFDVDDTLYNQQEPLEKAFYTVFPNLSNIDVNKLYIDRTKYSDEVFEKSCKGEITMEEMYIYRAYKAFLEQGVKISDEDALKFQYEYSKNQFNIHISKVIEQMLNYCYDKNIFMGIITNGLYEHQNNKIKNLGLYKWFLKENIFISKKVGFAKPDKGIFDIAKKVVNTDNIYYIGDSFKNDVEGAKKAGWKSIWLNKRKYNFESEFCPDFTVYNEEELFMLVKEIIKNASYK